MKKQFIYQWFAKLPHEVQMTIYEIVLEYQKAKEKHPNWPLDEIYAAAIVCEESGELIRAALQYKDENGNFENVNKEAVQTGAMALRFLVESIYIVNKKPVHEKGK